MVCHIVNNIIHTVQPYTNYCQTSGLPLVSHWSERFVYSDSRYLGQSMNVCVCFSDTLFVWFINYVACLSRPHQTVASSTFILCKCKIRLDLFIIKLQTGEYFTTSYQKYKRRWISISCRYLVRNSFESKRESYF